MGMSECQQSTIQSISIRITLLSIQKQWKSASHALPFSSETRNISEISDAAVHNFSPSLSSSLAGVDCRSQTVIGLATRDPHSSREGRTEGVCLLSAHRHILMLRALLQSLHTVPPPLSLSPSLSVSFSTAFFMFFSACSPDVVSSSSPRSFAPLRSVPPPGDLSQPLTASGALLDWIYMICPSINRERQGEREREREKEEMVVYLWRVR